MPSDVDAADLYDEADFGPLMSGHARRFRTFTTYLESHGLPHVFQPGEDPSLFDARLAAVRFPPPVRARQPSAFDRARHRATLLERRSRKVVRRRLGLW